MHGIYGFHTNATRPTHEEETNKEDMEEEECRVCREPAEDGRPLYHPCKCSGSIGLTHQDCLTSWLEVKGGAGKCDLCHYKFMFAPLYAPGAPESLSKLQVCCELMIQLIREWLPTGIRFLFVCFIWLVVLPLGTAYLYQGWMHRPSSIHRRINLDMIGNDIVQGGLLTVAIVVGFLSIMSLVDFFRSKWDKILDIRHHKQEEQDNHDENILIQPDVRVRMDSSIPLMHASPDYQSDTDQSISSRSSRNTDRSNHLGFDSHQDQVDSDPEDESVFARMMQIQEEDEEEDDDDASEDSQDEHNPLEGNLQPDRAVDLNVVEGLDGFEGELGMEFMRLIGLKGPLIDVIRNLLWVFAFQTAFIFLFICVPRVAGAVTVSLIRKSHYVSLAINYTLSNMIFGLFDLKTRDGHDLDIKKMIVIMNDESERVQSLVQPGTIGTVICGYLSYAIASFAIRGCIDIYKYLSISRLSSEDRVIAQIRNLHRLRRDVVNPEDMNARELRSFLLKQLDFALDCTEAASKISLLVCFKMFVLPLLLGVWLDLSTLHLFDSDIEDRLSNAGADVIGSFLMHWVFGITFMLFITISVLQLREVLHPDLLAPIIRPQDPQPDLLLQLLQDSGWTHVKRLIPSLTIYASLLFIHIWLPCRLIRKFDLQESIPLFRPKFWYLLNPTLQSAIELLIFHLSVLSILEKQKNIIGELQHFILLRLTNLFGVSRSVLPFAVSKSLALVGEVQLSGDLDEHRVGRTGHDNDKEFWKHLIELDKKRGATDEFLKSSLYLEEPSSKSFWAEGIITPDSCIVIASKTSENDSSRLVMRTHIGRYRFRKRIEPDKAIIEIWCESVQDPIPRPPEGWDYLGDGDTVEKGRWAWGKKEKKSDIERSVASRTLFFPPVVRNGQLLPQYWTSQVASRGIPTVLKLCCIAITSWMIATISTCTILFFPLFVGRWISHLLHIQDRYIHDPLLFLFGCILLSPVLISFVEHLTNKVPVKRDTQMFSFPPLRKTAIVLEALLLWLVLCPISLGTIYDTFFEIHPLNVSLMHMSTLSSSWGVGFFLLHFIGGMCYHATFRREFLRKLRDLVIDGIAGGRGGDDNRNHNRRAENNPPLADINNEVQLHAESMSDSWQGTNGRIGQFVMSMYSVLVRHEWDKVDRDTLVRKCLRPVLVSAISTVFISVGVHILSNALFDTGFLVYRSLIIMTLMVQIINLQKDSLSVWYRTVQKAARDHRYLIGKILLNYDQSQTKSNEH